MQLGQVFEKVINKIEEVVEDTTSEECMVIGLSTVITISFGIIAPTLTIIVAGFVVGLTLTGKLYLK